MTPIEKEQRQHLKKTVHEVAAELYDEMLGGLIEEAPFTELSAKEFSAIFRILLEPSLERHYRTLAPKFCQQFLGPDGSR